MPPQTCCPGATFPLDLVQGAGESVRVIVRPFPPLSQQPLPSGLHITPGPSSFLVPEGSVLAGKPPGSSASLSTFGKIPAIWLPPFSFPKCRSCGSPLVESNLKTGSLGWCPPQARGPGRQWAWGKGFLNSPLPPPPVPRPCPELMAFISPWHLSWSHSHRQDVPSPCLCAREPGSAMGNCLQHPVADEDSTKFSFEDDIWAEFNDSYDMDYNISNVEAAAPCRSCALLDDSSLPFFVLASVLGILAGGAVLLALLRPLFHWRVCPGRPVLIQLAVGSTLFSAVVPILAPGLNGVQSTALCHLAHLLWYSSAFAQALLIGCHACLGPKLGAGHVPGITLWLPVGLWGAALLLGLPVTLASDTSRGLCSLTFNKSPRFLLLLHVAACFTIFTLLPLGLLGAKALTKALGRCPGPQASVLWVWFVFWWPHGVALGVDFLVRSKSVVLWTCLAQQALDLLLHLAEALAILHCAATPLLLALSYHQTTRTPPPSLPLSARQPSHLDPLGGKS
ncbi:atypical chemokine receptor 1 [Suricata suricatta]|uniref:Atypical chemokine receptor 1 n=1 Tax=Suricata suricatta TaxID=37032 RepID=A0A673TE28_SURSU|nr:atypical chemokine receptor 1 [Suricata suricatta]